MGIGNMKKITVLIGLISGSIMLVGLFAPWIRLSSSPYRAENKNLTLQDKTVITGFDLMVGSYDTKKCNFSTEEVLQVEELKGPTKPYPILVIVGGLFAIIGGVFGFFSKRKLALALIIVGGILAFSGAFWCVIDTHWVRIRTISFGDYAFFGYWEYGLLIVLAGSLFNVLGTVISAKL